MKNIISLSSAGGGKTTRLISRIKEINSDKMLIVSFTKASCQDILFRLQSQSVNVMTLHGFAYSLLKEKYHIVPDSLIFVEMFLWKSFRLQSLGSQLISSLVENYFIFENLCEDISFLSYEDQQLNLEFKNLINDIKIEKSKHHAVFFADLINIVLKNFHLFKEEISRKYDHILVDEAQDLSHTQLQLLLKMITEVFTTSNKSFFIVGDKKQSIYSFQGSSEKFYSEFLLQVEEICSQKNVSFIYEQQNKTYRFGGKILEKVNSIFSGHTSIVEYGEVVERIMAEEDIYTFLREYISSYGDPLEDIMILYERNTQFIIKLQEKLNDFGMQCKIYLKNSKLIEALQDIYAFQQTGAEYYIAKILQGPFVFCNEPEFYEMAVKRQWDNEDLFRFLSLRKSAYETLNFLSKNVHFNQTDLLIFTELLKQSKKYLSLGEMLFSLSDTITIQKKGVKFSTIHSAKGLESKIVFYIKQKVSEPRIYISLSPFFFSTKQKNSNLDEKNNLEYVALSRAKEKLYIINYLG